MNPLTSFMLWLAQQGQTNPFDDPDNTVTFWQNQATGQMNQKITQGPDEGIHRFYDPNNGRSGQTGYDRED